jgi:hypothetical protein
MCQGVLKCPETLCFAYAGDVATQTFTVTVAPSSAR